MCHIFHGFGSGTPSSVARRTHLGRHPSITLKCPSQLGRVCGALLGLGFALGQGPRPGAPYYAQTVDDSTGAPSCNMHFGLLLATIIHQ